MVRSPHPAHLMSMSVAVSRKGRTNTRPGPRLVAWGAKCGCQISNVAGNMFQDSQPLFNSSSTTIVTWSRVVPQTTSRS